MRSAHIAVCHLRAPEFSRSRDDWGLEPLDAQARHDLLEPTAAALRADRRL
jgi:hypothetical protein